MPRKTTKLFTINGELNEFTNIFLDKDVKPLAALLEREAPRLDIARPQSHLIAPAGAFHGGYISSSPELGLPILALGDSRSVRASQVDPASA